MILYCIIVNIAHVFRAFNFHTSHAVRKYFNIEIFAIYSIYFSFLLSIVNVILITVFLDPGEWLGA